MSLDGTTHSQYLLHQIFGLLNTYSHFTDKKKSRISFKQFLNIYINSKNKLFLKNPHNFSSSKQKRSQFKKIKITNKKKPYDLRKKSKSNLSIINYHARCRGACSLFFYVFIYFRMQQKRMELERTTTRELPTKL